MDAILVLEDGRAFRGEAFGAEGEITAEVVFNTGMSGYQEILTDPSYCGQIINMTYTHMGNYGINFEDLESPRVQVAGFVVRDLCRHPSNYRARGRLGDWLAEQGVMGLEGIDTRALTRHIREAGSMNGVLSTRGTPLDRLRRLAAEAPHMTGRDLVGEVACREARWEEPADRGGDPLTVVLIDCGAKANIHRELTRRGCRVRIVPPTTPAEAILAIKPDGVHISNGPGDPAAVDYVVETLRGLVGKVPMFGICLGHQLLGLALGGETVKLKFGHRGINHPVKDLATGRVDITSQNHGFTVVAETLPPDVAVSHLNMSDRTVEGLRHTTLPIFSVQHHPEASPGPNDAKTLFDRFVPIMREHKR